MTSSKKTELVITPATWLDQAGNLARTQTHLFNLVGWYGSTHALAMWRKASEFLAVFQAEGIPGFDPQVEGWEPSFAAIEAEVLASASVIIMRLENNELVNGSLGSIAETGLALTSAALRGQLVIVSIENDLLPSLTEPGAIAQYMLLETFLAQIAKVTELAAFLRVHRGDDLQELALMACAAAHKQMKIGLTGLDFENFLVKRAKRQQNYPLRVVLGGSGGPYAEVHQETFLRKKEQLTSTYRAEGKQVKVLSEGIVAKAWSIPYTTDIDHMGIALAMQTLLAIEFEYKQEADVLLLPIMTEAASKAAATEIGFLLLNALVTGQDIHIFLEDFDPVDYMRHQLTEAEIKMDPDEKMMRQTLQQVGISASILATAIQAEVFETFALLKTLAQGDTSTYKQIKQSLLGKTEAFQKADNIRRVRVLVQSHLEKLSADARYPNFFSYSTQI